MNLGYKVYGLRIAANVPLPGLTIQPISSGIDVQIWLKDRKSDFPVASSIPEGDFRYLSPNCDEHTQPNLRVGTLAGGEYFVFFYSDGARFAVDHEGREVWADWPENYTLADACTYLMGPVIAFVLRLRGITCLHASAVVVDGRAVALFGFAGAGKSTTAAAFALGGFSVLSDDVVALADQGECFLVQPGYPRVNLWPASVRALFGSEDVLPRITPTWDKRYLALDQKGHRFQAEPLPLAAIYILGEREDGLTSPIVEGLTGREKFMTLVSNTYVNYLLDADMRTREFEVLARLVTQVPVRRVRPAAGTSKVFVLRDVIVSDAMEIPARDSDIAASGTR